MLELLAEPSAVAAAQEAVLASAHEGDGSLVARCEDAVRRDPGRIVFDPATGEGRLSLLGQELAAGRFETPSLSELRARLPGLGAAGAAPLRLCVLLGRAPLTDVGALQAIAGPGALFQVASQFNCLESPGPYVVDVAEYLRDPTQGPRASISAFPGTLLRHYAAPADDGTRFVQSEARQLDLLRDALPPEVARVRGGYLSSEGVSDPAGLLPALEAGFERIRVGVHTGVQVVLGYDFTGAVQGTPRIAQVFTSTYASGYSRRGALGEAHDPLCRLLLRAAYLGTLLAAVDQGARTVVLTAIGGGVFRNPHALIWEAIEWALDHTAQRLAAPLDVIFNARDVGVPRAELAAAAQARGGFLLELERGRPPVWERSSE